MIARLAVVAAVAVATGVFSDAPLHVVHVPAGADASAAIAGAPDGAIVRLGPGRHEPIVVSRRVILMGVLGASVRGPVRVSADAARLTSLRIYGGENGVEVHEADHVIIERVAIRDSELHGIEIASGSAMVTACDIRRLGRWSQGVEVRNANGRPRTIVQGCRITGAREGIVAHVSRVEFRDNHVTGSRYAGVAITEMSEGIAAANRIEDAAGVGLYCGDMSRCEFRDNMVRRIAADPDARNLAGFGAIAWYHATMRLDGNVFEDLAASDPVGTFIRSSLTNEFPPSVWPPGWAAALPSIALVSVLSLAGLFVVARLMRPVAGRIRPRAGPLAPAAAATVAAGALVQVFHMAEHGIQVAQVYVAQAEVRSGLVGRHFDVEWMHLAFNVAVLAFLAAMTVMLWGRTGIFAGAMMLAAMTIEAYHVVEHVVKITQHLDTGVTPAPGLLGAHAGLIWFHYGINLAVTAGMLVAAAAGMRRGRTLRRSPTSVPVAR